MLSVIIFGLAACGQKGPLQPEPMPEQNEPSETGTSPTEKNGAV
nr:lipoprotein [Idiomarina seosinensis]